MKITALEVKHIAPYLQYDLEITANDDNGKAGRFTVIGIIQDEVSAIDMEASYNWNIKDIKPLLIPLDKFTDENWIEVFKAGFTEAGLVGWPIGEVSIERHDNLAVELIHRQKSYSYDMINRQFETMPYAFNQVAALDKMYQLKGDVFNLIDNELASYEILSDAK